MIPVKKIIVKKAVTKIAPRFLVSMALMFKLKFFDNIKIGIIDIIDGTGIYKKLIGNKCKYAVSYFKKNIQYQTKCDFDLKILTN